MSGLNDRDWLSFFKGSLRERRRLLDIIESLGYDGYFNREVDKELAKHSAAAGCEVDLKLLGSPSVGIFNKDCLEKVETVSDIRNDFRVKRYVDLELDYIEYKLLLAYKNGSSLSDVYEELYGDKKYADAFLSVEAAKEALKRAETLCNGFGNKILKEAVMQGEKEINLS